MTIKEMRATIGALAAAYRDTLDNGGSPANTARNFIQAVGPEEAAQCVAAMIRRAHWDGRISREVKAWAQGTPLSAEWERHVEDTHCDAIHPAHLSQIAEAMPIELDSYDAETQETQETKETQETQETRKRRIKWDALLHAMTNYYDDYRATFTIDGVQVRGRVFKADSVDPDKLKGYNNVMVLKGRTQYAPEITFSAVFVGDKCFR